MAHYILNSVREEATSMLREGRWRVGAGERHRGSLAAGDLVLVYVDRVFVARARLASAAGSSGVALEQIEERDPPVPMDAVLARLDSATAKGDFDAGVVLISEREYETVLAVAEEANGA
jgi:hypothetical protein